MPEEAEIVKEIAARILGMWDGWTDEQRAKIDTETGESLNSIAADLQRRHVPTVTGAVWNARSVRSVVTKPRVAGLRTHRKEVVGAAVWPAILDQATWEEVCARIAGRHRAVDLTLQRWLTGVLVCSQCDRLLMGWQGNGGPRYWCATPKGGCGKIAVKASIAEEEIERRVLDLLGQPRILDRLRSVASSEATDEARQSLADDEAQLKQMAGMYARREITFAEYREARGIIEARIKKSRALVHSRAPRVLRRMLAGKPRENWTAAKPVDKREVVLSLVKGYQVLPHDRAMGNKFDPGRLVPMDPE